MVYWSTVILTVDKDGYYNKHHRTYLWYTGLPSYLQLTMMVTIAYIIEYISGILWPTVILPVDNDGYYNRHHRTYLWYTGIP